MDTDEVFDKGYLLALKHAIDRLDINNLAGVDQAITLQEFRDWYKEKGGQDDSDE